MNTRERLEKMEQARRERLERTWPGECPTCFASPGEPCISIAGKKTRIHWPRAAMRATDGIQHEMDTASLETA